MSGFVRRTDEFGGALVVQKGNGADTAGQLAVMEMICPSGLDVPEHVHPIEDELFYLLSGQLEGFCGEDTWTAEPGSLVFLPRTVPHGFTVTGREPARVLIIVGPPEFDHHVAESGMPAANRPPPST